MRAGVLAIFLALSCVAGASLVNENVVRRVNIQTNVADIVTEVTVANTGSSPVSTYELAFTAADASSIADVEARSAATLLTVKKGVSNEKEIRYTVTLDKPISPGGTARLEFRTIQTHVLSAHPSTIEQTDNQLVVYFGNTYLYSPYPTTTVKTEVQLGTPSVETYEPKQNAALKGSAINFGPYKNVAAFSEQELVIHYQNNYPFMTVRSLLKEVEVSHWGHISFEEHLDLTHSGAKLKRGFSRLDFQRKAAPSHFRQLFAKLPPTATGIYYRDVIGNISTSRVRVDRPENGDAYTSLELLPRYLLFGGWKTAFYFGYSVGLSEFLGVTKDGTYSLHVPFGTTIQGPVVNNATVKVILPEGASDITFSGIEGLESWFEVRQTYLDTVGRPVLVVSKTNVVGDNRKTLVVNYRFPSSAIYQELLLPIGAFFSLFLFFIFVGRFHLSIGEDGKKLEKENALELLTNLNSLTQSIRSLADASGDAKAVEGNLEKLLESSKLVPEFTSRISTLGKTVSEIISSHKAGNSAKRKELITGYISKAGEFEKEIRP